MTRELMPCNCDRQPNHKFGCPVYFRDRRARSGRSNKVGKPRVPPDPALCTCGRSDGTHGRSCTQWQRYYRQAMRERREQRKEPGE